MWWRSAVWDCRGRADGEALMGKLTGKVVIVTGASRGLGVSQAQQLAAAGAKVVLTSARSLELGEQVAAAIGDAAVFMQHDVSRAADWQRVVVDTEQRFGPISVLVNNAGIVIPASIEEQTEEQFRQTFEVNQLGSFLGMKTVLPSMRRAGGGSIINISSVAGLRSSVASIAYGATKFAIRGMTRKAAVELAPMGIRVNVVFPGFFETDNMQLVTPARRAALINSVPMKRIGDPNEVAAMIVFLASDEASYCTGGEYVVDGGFTA
jgi:3alpha(or 20beta)-hydroxysteroid dehydrogenase